MKKIIIVFLSLFIVPVSLNAVSSDDVDYKIIDYVMDVNVEISGNLKVREIIGVEGTFNGYIRDIVYKNSNLNEYENEFNFQSNAMYNATNVIVEKVGSVKWNGELNFEAFKSDINLFNECSNSRNCYEMSLINDGVSLKMFNETKYDITYFYIEYLIGNVVVIHEDVAEVYYTFIGEDFLDDISRFKLRLSLPFGTKEDVRVWAHGPLNGEVYLISDDKDGETIYYGGYLAIDDLPSKTSIDMRMVFPKSLISIEHPFLKKSNVVALDKILEVEEKRAEEANLIRKKARFKVLGTYVLTGIYFLISMGVIVYIYFKYDKERKSQFQGEYNREFIDDYDVTIIEYLFNRSISEKAFSTSILNMIYKKNISFERVNDKDYVFSRLSDDNLSEAEKLVMSIIFDEAGDGKTTSLKDIKKYASRIDDTSSPFLNKFNSWKSIVTKEAKSEGFYENLIKIKAFTGVYSILGFVIFFLHITLGIFNILTFSLIVFNIGFIIYIVLFNKKTEKGVLHYSKWKAFKKFLLDFGNFDEKDLPEIILWERYLVYANIFGIADKLSKTMKIKFNELHYNTNDGDIMFDYILWSNLNSSINSTVSSSISTAHTKIAEVASTRSSSGSGFGGGFSSGGGFGGGGGGGRGF